MLVVADAVSGSLGRFLERLIAYAPIVLSAAPALWVAVRWDAELSLAFPVLVSAFPLAARTPLQRAAFRWVAVALLLLFDTLAMLSVGNLFLPATLAMVLAAVWGTFAGTSGNPL
jgi:hypothetical protein